MAVPTNPDQRAARLASRQFGALSHHQAIACGLTDSAIATRIRKGQWRRVVVGVYVVAGSPDTWQQRAMVAQLAHAAVGGVLSHLTAAGARAYLRPSFLPHVSVPPTASHKARAAKVHRSAVPLVDRSRVDGLLVTSASRTICDLSTMLDRPTLAEVIDVAFCRGEATRDSVLAADARRGERVRGRKLLHEELEVWTPEITPDSPAEMRALRMLVDLGVPELVTQYEVFDEDGAFVARLDLAAPRLKAAVEYDGVQAHNPRAWARDEPRYQRLRALGWDVDGITKFDLLPGRPRLPELVERWRRHAAALSIR